MKLKIILFYLCTYLHTFLFNKKFYINCINICFSLLTKNENMCMTTFGSLLGLVLLVIRTVQQNLNDTKVTYTFNAEDLFDKLSYPMEQFNEEKYNLAEFVKRILCGFNASTIYIYFDVNLNSILAELIIFKLFSKECSTLFIVK